MRWGRVRRPEPQPAPAPPPEPALVSGKFVSAAPSDRNAVDVFRGRWVEPIETDDVAGELRRRAERDGRPRQAAQHLGLHGRLDGMAVLELGPLEGAQTCLLEALGGVVIAVEGNAEAYLKCLVAKEVLGLRARMRLGSFEALLDEDATRYDLIFASGVLYHMADPLRLIERIAARTDRAYVWTHFHDPQTVHRRAPEPGAYGGFSTPYHRAVNLGSAENPRWWGGLDPYASWMERDEIVRAFRHFGFGSVEVVDEGRPGGEHPSHFALACRR